MTDTPQIPSANSLESSPPSSSGRLRLFAITLGLLVLAAGLRWYKIGDRDVWIDEANGVLIAMKSLPVLIDRLKLDSSPPLYYFVLKVWMLAFGESEAAIRSLSLLGGVALTLSVLVLGRRWFSLEIGVIAALLIATAPIQIFYSQQARMYAWLPVAALWSFHWLGRAIREGHARFLVYYAFCILAALYTHNYGLYLLPAQAVIILFSGVLKKAPLRWCVCGLAVVLGYSPWTPVLLEQLRNSTHYSWFIPFWNEVGWHGAVKATLLSFAPGGEQPIYVGLPGANSISTYSALTIVLLFLMGAGDCVGKKRSAERRSATRTLYAATLLPLLTALIASSILTPNYVPGRCDQLVFPFFILSLAVGCGRLRPAILRYIAVSALLIFAIFGLKPHYQRPFHPSERTLALDIAHRAQPDDVVLCTSLTRAPLEYYRMRFQIPIALYSYPHDTAEHLGSQDDPMLLSQPDKLRAEARALIKEIRESRGPRAHFFLVMEQTSTPRGFAPSAVDRIFLDETEGMRKTRTLATVGTYTQAGIGQAIVVTYVQLE